MQRVDLLLEISMAFILFLVAVYNYYTFSKRVYHNETGKEFDKATIISFLFFHVAILVSFSALVVYILSYIKAAH